MDRPLMYHNPVCSKSRGALEIIQERGDEVEVIEYLQQPLTRADFERVLDLIEDPPEALVRKDKHFKELGLNADDYKTRDQVIDLLLEHPRLMERPVIIVGDKAVIARPSERVLEVLP